MEGSGSAGVVVARLAPAVDDVVAVVVGDVPDGNDMEKEEEEEGG